jgi:hypothetical protein
MWNVKCMKFLLCLPKHTTYRHFRRRRSVVYVSVSFSNSLPGTRVCPLPLHCAESEMKWESYLFLSMSMFSFQNHRMVRELHKVLWIFSPVNVSVSRRNLFSVESVLLYGWCTWVGLVLRPGVHLTICHTHTRGWRWRCYSSRRYYPFLAPQCIFRTRVIQVTVTEQNNS